MFVNQTQAGTDLRGETVYVNFFGDRFTNETGPLPLCTFSVMGLSMCSACDF